MEDTFDEGMEGTFNEDVMNMHLAPDVADLVNKHARMMSVYNWPQGMIDMFLLLPQHIHFTGGGLIMFTNKEWEKAARRAEFGYSGGRPTGFLTALEALHSNYIETALKPLLEL